MHIARSPKTALAAIDQLKQYASSIMKKYICILASAALLAACEQKTETVTPAASPSETTTTATSPAESTPMATMSPMATATPMETATPATPETSTTTETTTSTASPTP